MSLSGYTGQMSYTRCRMFQSESSLQSWRTYASWTATMDRTRFGHFSWDYRPDITRDLIPAKPWAKRGVSVLTMHAVERKAAFTNRKL